jgi:hypothetical protein
MRDNGTLACSATMKASSGHLEETGSSACNEAPEKVCLLPANWAGRPPPRQGARAEAPDSRLAALTGRRVCTENLIRVDDVMESPKLAE